MADAASQIPARAVKPGVDDLQHWVEPVHDDAVTAAIRIDQTMTIVRMIPLMMISNLGVPLTIVITVSHALPLWFIVIWLGTITALIMPVLISWLRLRKLPRPVRVSPRRIRVITLWSTVMGMTIAVGCFYVFPRAGSTSQIVTELCVLGLWAGAMIATWKIASALIGFVLPLAVAMLLAIAVNIDIAIAGFEVALTIVMFLFLVGWALRIHQTYYWETARMQLEHVSQSGEIVRRRKAEAELQASLEELHDMQDKLILQEKMASLGAVTAGVAHEVKNPLNFIVNFSRLSADIVEDLRGRVDTGTVPPDDAAAVTEDLQTLSDNLDKILKHGRRADGIVKTMLMHSRTDPGTRAPTMLNPLIAEGVDLAHHGARAQDPSFNVDIEVDLDDQVRSIHGSTSQFMRVIINLVRNALQSARDRGIAEGRAFAPKVTVTSKIDGECIIIAIRDNGLGIAPEHRKRLFQPFFTTKAAGEGTGLGLSISFEIIAQHGGEIVVDSVPGEYAEFRIVLPRTGGVNLSDARRGASDAALGDRI